MNGTCLQSQLFGKLMLENCLRLRSFKTSIKQTTGAITSLLKCFSSSTSLIPRIHVNQSYPQWYTLVNAKLPRETQTGQWSWWLSLISTHTYLHAQTYTHAYQKKEHLCVCVCEGGQGQGVKVVRFLSETYPAEFSPSLFSHTRCSNFFHLLAYNFFIY